MKLHDRPQQASTGLNRPQQTSTDLNRPLEAVPRDYFSHARQELIPLIPRGTSRLLDVGCGSGVTGRLAKDLLAIPEVWGIEAHPDASAMAATRLDHVISADIETCTFQWPADYFDCIVCADILEHLRDPWSLLNRLRSHLTPGGVLIASIPNLQHLSSLLPIALNRFEYQDEGILDQTHLRFFTEHTIRLMFEQAGFTIESMGANESRSWKFLAVKWLSLGVLRRCCVFQYLVVARRV